MNYEIYSCWCRVQGQRHGVLHRGQRRQQGQGRRLDLGASHRGLHHGGLVGQGGPAGPPGTQGGGDSAQAYIRHSGEELQRRAPGHGKGLPLHGVPDGVHRRGRL